MEKLDAVLSKHPFFKGLDSGYIALLAGCGKIVRFDSGQFIFHEGEEANAFYLIRHGKVALEMHAPGRGLVVIETLGEGSVLGWSWLFPPYKWHFDARAVELASAIHFDGGCIRKKCEADPKLGYDLLNRFAAILIERLQATRIQLLDVYGAPS